MSVLLTLSRSIFHCIKPAFTCLRSVIETHISFIYFLPMRLKHSKAQFAIQENSMWKSK